MTEYSCLLLPCAFGAWLAYLSVRTLWLSWQVDMVVGILRKHGAAQARDDQRLDTLIETVDHMGIGLTDLIEVHHQDVAELERRVWALENRAT